jgi:hypothetical protein
MPAFGLAEPSLKIDPLLDFAAHKHSKVRVAIGMIEIDLANEQLREVLGCAHDRSPCKNRTRKIPAGEVTEATAASDVQSRCGAHSAMLPLRGDGSTRQPATPRRFNKIYCFYDGGGYAYESLGDFAMLPENERYDAARKAMVASGRKHGAMRSRQRRKRQSYRVRR